MAGFNPIQLVGQVGEFHQRGQAAQKLRAAGRQQRTALLVRNIQRRRAFIRAARGAQAQNLVAGAQREGGLESSAFQGIEASIQTQSEFGRFEFDTSQLRQQKIGALVAGAERDVQQAQTVKQATEFVSNVGGLFS